MNFQVNYDQSLGDGQLGKIYEALEGQRKLCAKVIEEINLGIKFKSQKNYFSPIINANHANIVKIYQVQYEENVQIIYMDYYKNGNLLTYLQKQNLQLEGALQIMNQILKGLKFLKDHGYQIDNIKLNNILLDIDGHIKLSDLWFTPVVRNHDTQKYDQVYLSPQVLTESPQTDKKNIYALGIIFYYIVYKSFPYERNNQRKFFSENKKNIFRCPDILLQGEQNKKEELKTLIQSMLKFEEAERSDWNQLLKCPLFEFQAVFSVFNSDIEQQDQQFLNLTRIDQSSIIQDEVESYTTSIELINQQLSQKMFNGNQEDSHKKINILSVGSITVNKSSCIRIIQKNQILDSMLMSIQRNEKQVHYSNQKLSKADRVAKIIQIDMAKYKIAEMGIQLLRKNKLPIRDLYLYALIVALSGYKSNLLVNSIGFAYNSPQNINKQILEEWKQDYIFSAIQEFTQSTDQSHQNLKEQLYQMSQKFSNQYSDDYKQFNSCLDLENDRFDALDQLAVPKQSRGMYSPYQQYMEWIKFIFNKYVKGALNVQNCQEKNKIIVIKAEIKILAVLKYICNLEQAFNFQNYYVINPDEIKIDETKYINML